LPLAKAGVGIETAATATKRVMNRLRNATTRECCRILRVVGFVARSGHKLIIYQFNADDYHNPVITNTLGRIQIRTNAVGVALDDFEVGDGRHSILDSGLPNRRKHTIFLHLYSFTWIFLVHETLRIVRLNPVLGVGYLIRFYEVIHHETMVRMVKWRRISGRCRLGGGSRSA